MELDSTQSSSPSFEEQACVVGTPDLSCAVDRNSDAGNARDGSQGARQRRENRWPERIVLLCLLALAIFVAGVQGFWVSGDCMRPGLVTGDRLLADKLTYRVHPPRRGDVVIFYYPRDPQQIYVKRVIGLPGETVEIRSGDVYINSHRLDEPYRIYAAHGSMAARRVPYGDYFVLGDNRDVSDDSRYWGYLPRQEIIGRAVGRYWPLFGGHRPVMASPH